MDRAQYAVPSVAQRNCQRNVLKCVASSLPSDLPSRSEAARLLLGSHLDYAGDGSAVVPYDPGLVSLPDERMSPVPLHNILLEATSNILSVEHLLADDDVYAYNVQNLSLIHI